LVRIRNNQPNSGKWSKKYIIRLALEEYLDRNEAELRRGGKKPLPKSKDRPLDHPKRIINFEEAKKRIDKKDSTT